MDLEKRLNTFLGKQPQIGRDVYIARGAVVVGDVTLGDHASVWYNAVLRGDINRIVVGAYTNIQDNAVLHLENDLPCIVGNYVTIGHSAIVHACTVGDETLIGMGSVILDGADRKSTRLNSSHGYISYAVFCLKKKKKKQSIVCQFD